MWRRIGFISAGVVGAAAFGGLCFAQAPLNGDIPMQTPFVQAQEEHAKQVAALYQESLAKYLRCIDVMQKEMDDSEAVGYKDGLAADRESSQKQAAREEDITRRLLKVYSRGSIKLLDPIQDNADDENLLPASAASARMFTKLWKAGCVDTEELVQKVCNYSGPLPKEWFPMLHEIADNAPKGSNLEGCTAVAFYQNGIAVEKYKALLISRALGERDLAALNTLLFDRDPVTYAKRPVESPENADLVKRLPGKENDPLIRLACASYLFFKGDRALGESICMDIVEQRYADVSPSGGPANIAHGWALDLSKKQALGMAFYRAKNERAFKAVFDRTGIAKSSLTDLGFAAQINSQKTGTSYGEEETRMANLLVARLRDFPDVKK